MLLCASARRALNSYYAHLSGSFARIKDAGAFDDAEQHVGFLAAEASPRDREVDSPARGGFGCFLDIRTDPDEVNCADLSARSFSRVMRVNARRPRRQNRRCPARLDYSPLAEQAAPMSSKAAPSAVV